MDTVDKADEVATKKRGRPSKQDPATPLGQHIAEQALANKKRKLTNKVVEKWYELRGKKLSLCKKTVSGTVYRTFVGSLDDPKSGEQIRTFTDRLVKENKLKHRV